MAVVCKPTVRLKGITTHLLAMLHTLLWLDGHPVDGQPPDLVITSINDSAHSQTSKHYTNEAMDVRSKSFPSALAKQHFLEALYAQLPKTNFYCFLEDPGTDNEHFHLQRRRNT